MKKVKNITILLLILVILTACSDKTEVFSDYADEYISFSYPQDWEMQFYSFDGQQIIMFDTNSDSQFVVNIDTLMEPGSADILEKQLQEVYNLAKEMTSIELVSYQDTTINGQQALEIELHVKLMDSFIEHLYRTLSTELITYNEVAAYLEQYENIEAFISGIKGNPEKLDEIDELTQGLEPVDFEDEHSVRNVNAFINGIQQLFEEERDISFIQNFIVTFKDHNKYQFFYQGTVKEFNTHSEWINRIIDSVRLTN